jgi:hypothetical protein
MLRNDTIATTRLLCHQHIDLANLADAEPLPPALPPLAVQSRFEPRATASEPLLAPVPARFEAGGPEVTSDVLVRVADTAPAQPPGLPTELLVVLDASGEARHVWLVRSCGDPALDTAAIRAVQLSRFGPSEAGYRGMLRVVWGMTGAKP